MGKILNALISGVFLFSSGCSKDPKTIQERAEELATPLIERHAENWEIPVDSLRFKYGFSEDSSKATVACYYNDFYEIGVNIDFKKDSASYTVY